MPDCDTCGDPLQAPRDKNAAGWWRDRCLPCIRAAAPDTGGRAVAASPDYQDWLDTHE